MFKWINFFMDLLADESKHFFLASFMGSVAFWWTSIISYATGLAWEKLTLRKVNTAVVFFTTILLLLLGLSVVLLSHAYLDKYSIWYTTPSGPPLELKVPNK